MGRHLTPLEEQAESAVALSISDPDRARAVAHEVLAAAGDDADATAIAEHALGSAAAELGELHIAEAHLHRALELARKRDLKTLAAQTSVKLAGVLVLEGEADAALAELAEAAHGLDEVDAARVGVQRAMVVQRLGRWDDAVSEYRAAIPVLRRVGARVDEAKALVNRAILLTWRGDYAAAEADLRRAEALRVEVGEAIPAGIIHANLTFVAGRRGDVPAALAWSQLAEAELPPRGAATTLLDRCETLLSVRLVPEAKAAAEQAVAKLEKLGLALDLAEARVLLAQAQLLDGDVDGARRSATDARAEFVRQDRPGWASLAAYVDLLATWQDGAGINVDDVEPLIADLEGAGWTVPAMDTRLIGARSALEQGNTAEARRLLETAAPARRRGPADLRARAWHADALLRLAGGDGAGADRSLRAGMRVLEEHRATLGATELRVHAATRAEELAELGMRLALDSGRAARVFAWAERWRAGSLRWRPARPPADAGVAHDLAELRHVTAAIEQASLDGRPAAELAARQANLEDGIRARLRSVRPPAFAPSDRVPTLEALRAGLDGRVLVELVASEGRLYAVTVTARRSRLVELGDVGEVAGEVDALCFAYTRLARGSGTASSLETFASTSEFSARRLDELLLQPLAKELADNPLVVVPTGALHRLPWAGLASCRGRPVSVVPSAALWLRASAPAAAKGGGGVLLVAGPDLPHADGEMWDLAAIHPRAIVLAGAEATTARVSQALDGADLAHVAAHGDYRFDNPLFSSLHLHDGDLTVYDLELLSQAPRLFVLSACESGVHDVRPGDELMGLAAALFALGSTTLIASVVPVPDVATRPLMVEFHCRLAAGDTPASALAGAQAVMGRDLGTPATAGFVCMGV